MKKLIYMTMATLLMVAMPVNAAVVGAKGEKFQKIYYFECGGKGSGSGQDRDNAHAIAADGDIDSIEAGTMIEKMYIILETAITGTTNLDFGDDDDADGFVDSSLSVTLATPGMYGWDAKLAGAYLRVQTAGATDAADIYVVPSAKYYSAAGKEIKMDLTTACTAGKFQLVVEGYKFKL